MKRGAYIVNTARGKFATRDDIAAALKTGQLAGYAGDVWFPQPAPQDHPWRTMPHHGMTPHTSGTTLSAQARYAAGTREILECWFEKRPIREEYLIVDGGKLAGTGAHSTAPAMPPEGLRRPRNINELESADLTHRACGNRMRVVMLCRITVQRGVHQLLNALRGNVRYISVKI